MFFVGYSNFLSAGMNNNPKPFFVYGFIYLDVYSCLAGRTPHLAPWAMGGNSVWNSRSLLTYLKLKSNPNFKNCSLQTW